MAFRRALYMIAPLLFLLSCGQDEAQLQFEREAFGEPSGFTKTSGTGEIDRENVDEDDWRISPFFSGLVYSVDPIYPNPVLSNDRLTLQISLAGINDIQRIQVYSFSYQLQASILVEVYPGPIRSIVILSLDAGTIPFHRENPLGLHRLIVTDERENVITYGDVLIE